MAAFYMLSEYFEALYGEFPVSEIPLRGTYSVSQIHMNCKPFSVHVPKDQISSRKLQLGKRIRCQRAGEKLQYRNNDRQFQRIQEINRKRNIV